MASVFLSYDHEDSALARPLAQALEKAGHTVWFDRHIHGGAQYSRKIEQALNEADAVLVLWSERSLDSAWVRDEAAEGRDRNKLVPLSVGGITPPMGFRQFQTIDLGSWKGRGKVPRLAEINEAIENQSDAPLGEPAVARAAAAAAPARSLKPQRWIVAAALVLIIVIGGFGLWRWLGRGDLPVVEVAAANGSARSQAAATDLFVKLGSLAQIGEGKWKLVDANSAPSKPAFVFRAADLGSPQSPQANLVMLDGNDDSLLWSREFTAPAGGDADLRQQMSFTAGRVLGCALESRDAGNPPRNLVKLFLDSCATLADASYDEPGKLRDQLRSIVQLDPNFKPAWGRLLYADVNMVDTGTTEDRSAAIREMQSDMKKARALDPNIPELSLAELRLLPDTAYAQRLDLLTKAADRAPNESVILAEEAGALQSVGRMVDGVILMRRASELDPLSPPRDLINTLAAAGQIEAAQRELDRAARLWPGTGALRDAVWAFHLRYGDPEVARRNAPFQDDGLNIYLDARANASPANVDRVVAYIHQLEGRPVGDITAGAVQALGEFNQVDNALGWLARTPADQVAHSSYILFRPGMKSVRQDPRFMAVAKRIGLLDYWRKSGKWPDFCDEPTLPYDCKAEAAKLG